MSIQALEVSNADACDVYRDIARIHREDRGLALEGHVCKISVNGRSKYLSVRGIGNEPRGYIQLDALSRIQLGISVGEVWDFEVVPSRFWGQIVWGWHAADPLTRLSTQVAIISLGLGLLGAVLGGWSLVLSLSD